MAKYWVLYFNKIEHKSRRHSHVCLDFWIDLTVLCLDFWINVPIYITIFLILTKMTFLNIKSRVSPALLRKVLRSVALQAGSKFVYRQVADDIHSSVIKDAFIIIFYEQHLFIWIFYTKFVTDSQAYELNWI